ncbi:MAG: hypothetical protein RSA65_03060, partial [Clostridia bacterium]
IFGYLDSEGQAQACVYEQGMALKRQGDYANAVALLQTVSTYDDAQQQIYECNYHLAQDAIAAGNDLLAEERLENVDRYQDSERLLRT